MRTPLRHAALFGALALACVPAWAEVHEVKMLNRGASGAMVYEPEYLVVAPGDSVKFIASHSTHNAASIPGFHPEGAATFKGRINEEIEVTLEQPGFYGIQCIPHYAMGMVMLIQVGEPGLDQLAVPAGLPNRAAERFARIVEQAKAATGI
ncbi:pseudoazurin [Pseudomonas sp. ABC1]|uniref:pseudoazurin n=1 Tax=Pseudomonas sp. ABC1 TaxID=2748080 RepID=UPI0015C3F808|nr:pseudoazurin [Pseudomonas sp. ABC1]QLF93585.1 pseudoazurin [Pseudomonas sp. ABC1]